MHVQTHTNDSVNGSEDLAERVESIVDEKLKRFGSRISSVEVHLNDENKGKGGADDMRCMMEARLDGLPPVAVTHHAADLIDAIRGAAQKLERALDSRIGKLNAR